MKQRWLTRAVALALCSIMLLAAGSLTLYAVDEEPAAELVPQEEIGLLVFDLPAQEEEAAPAEEDDAADADLEEQGKLSDLYWEEDEVHPEDGKPLNFLDKFLRIFSWFGYTADANGMYVYNQKATWQWLTGYNELYDSFAWLIFAFPDTIVTKFNYDGKEWLIKFWKGSYVWIFATGAEIGVYNRPEWFPLNHYFAATEPDMLKMEFTLYYKLSKMLRRAPVQEQWWLTAYKPNITFDLFKRPRADIVLDTTIKFKDPCMARAFLESFAALEDSEGEPAFAEVPDVPGDDGYMGLRNTDTYKLSLSDNVSVRIVWQNYSDNWF